MMAVIYGGRRARLNYAMIIQLLLPALLSASAQAAPVVALSTAAAVAANERVSTRCSKGPLDLDGFLGSASARADLAPSTIEEQREIMEYSVCRALLGSPACPLLEGTKADGAHCATLAAEARFAFAVLRDGDALASCRAVMALDNQRGPAVDRSCGVMIKAVRGGDVAAACPALEKEGIITAGNTCADIRALWSGSSNDCARYKDGSTRRECVVRAAMVAGFRERRECAQSPYCRALAEKAADACDGLRAQAARSICGRAAKDLAAVRALEPQSKAQIEATAKEKAAKTTAAAVAAANAKVAAEKAKVDAAAEKAKAQTAADAAAVAKMAAAAAAKKAQADAAVAAKAQAEAAKEAKAKEIAAKNAHEQFDKGMPMESTTKEGREMLKAMEEGRPLPQPKPKPKPKPKAEAER